MSDVIKFPPVKDINENLAPLEARAQIWWDGTKFPDTVAKIPMPQSLRDWIEKVAKQAWVEGAITAVQGYGDELRSLGVLPPREDKG